MSGITGPTPGDTALASAVDLILDRVVLVDISSLRFYERPAETRVDEIEKSLLSTGQLINPVIVDTDRQLLIDGHHRVRAFHRLGIGRIPAFTVDYLSADVMVRGWSHTTDATPARVAGEFAGRPPSPARNWAVLAADAERHIIGRREFDVPEEGARYLIELNSALQAAGHTVTLRTRDDALRGGYVHSYIEPVVGKSEVLEMVNGGGVFPHEVNRHLIEDRPLQLRVPLEDVGSAGRFQRHLDEIARKQAAFAVGPGFREGERLYEERVTLLRPRSDDL